MNKAGDELDDIIRIVIIAYTVAVACVVLAVLSAGAFLFWLFT